MQVSMQTMPENGGAPQGKRLSDTHAGQSFTQVLGATSAKGAGEDAAAVASADPKSSNKRDQNSENSARNTRKDLRVAATARSGSGAFSCDNTPALPQPMNSTPWSSAARLSGAWGAAPAAQVAAASAEPATAGMAAAAVLTMPVSAATLGSGFTATPVRSPSEAETFSPAVMQDAPVQGAVQDSGETVDSGIGAGGPDSNNPATESASPVLADGVTGVADLRSTPPVQASDGSPSGSALLTQLGQLGIETASSSLDTAIQSKAAPQATGLAHGGAQSHEAGSEEDTAQAVYGVASGAGDALSTPAPAGAPQAKAESLGVAGGDTRTESSNALQPASRTQPAAKANASMSRNKTALPVADASLVSPTSTEDKSLGVAGFLPMGGANGTGPNVSSGKTRTGALNSSVAMSAIPTQLAAPAVLTATAFTSRTADLPVANPVSSAAQATSGKDGAQAENTAAAQPEAAPQSVLPSITNARLVQSLSGSAMQVRLHSEDFGQISVHTAYGRDAIATQITLENSQLGSALGSALHAHVATMEQKLGQDHGLRASVSIDTRQESQPNRGNEQRGSDSQTGRRPNFSSSQSTPAATPLLTGTAQRTSTANLSGSSRLDIRI